MGCTYARVNMWVEDGELQYLIVVEYIRERESERATVEESINSYKHYERVLIYELSL